MSWDLLSKDELKEADALCVSSDVCSGCGSHLEDVWQEQTIQDLEPNGLNPGSYNVVRQGVVLAGWCPGCQTTRRTEVWQDGGEGPQW